MSSPNEINGRNVDTEKANETQKLKHIHIGVFFDGTSNNMVQQMMYNGMFNMSIFGLGRKKTPSEKLEQQKQDLEWLRLQIMEGRAFPNELYDNPLEDIIDQKIKELDNKIPKAKKEETQLENAINRIFEQRGKLHKTNILYNACRVMESADKSTTPLEISRHYKAEIENIEDEIDKLCATIEVSENNLMGYSDENGFSNIAVLYSLFNCGNLETEGDTTAKAIKFYIEGSGATGLSSNVKSNVNGLGFGLGLTGVTALVSKGIRVVTDYVKGLESEIDDSTKVHLYVFGFSRGATCARLFTHIVTRERDDSEILKIREKEFEDFIPKLMKKGRVKFLDDSIKKWKNISVEILGIYDTVASIGFLRQKDGWSDPLRGPYEDMPNYINNWHYKNATQYGLYLCQDKGKLKKVIHIGALDEFRENFAFTNIGTNVNENALEILIPGCHSDVGGGYMSGVEQEIYLPFYTTKNNMSLRTAIPLCKYNEKPQRSYITAPNTKIDIGVLESNAICAESLKYVGWIADWETEKKKKKAERITYTMAEDEDKIYFKRMVRRGWSDVALSIMLNKVEQLKIFKPSIVYNYEKTLDNDKIILNLARDVVSKCDKTAFGKRYMIVPGGSISSPIYKRLRLHYIHFTSSASLAHIKNPFRNMELNAPLAGNAGNFGNKPNFDLEGNLCRITYYGDKVAGLESNDVEDGYKKHVHYMYELGVNCEIL